MRIVNCSALFLLAASVFGQTAPWDVKQANTWYNQQAWLVGSNYIPASAINELEMWQKETWDPVRIDRELGWAQDLGMTTMRVFLHDLLWEDSRGFSKRMDQFLTIAEKHRIKPMFVLFDSCWDPDPKLGPQKVPTPGVHNSGWVQSPGSKSLEDPADYKRLEKYVRGVVAKFKDDERILAWDVWNEPDNLNGSSYGKNEPADKVERVNTLLPQVFRWARLAGATQPLTSGVWKGTNWASDENLSATERIQLTMSDVISFHNYGKPEEFEKCIKALERFQRPILCTEYMARGNGSTFAGTLPVARQYQVAAINWGFAQGKTQTNLPWDSWKQPYTDRKPAIWFHEIFDGNGKPYQEDEVDLIKRLTGAKRFRKAA